jgi:enoyl-CoA hydratase/carnithine racemase
MTDVLKLEVEGRIATLTINRPESMNAITTAMLKDMTALLDQVDQDNDVRVLVVTGAGTRAFCAGADLSASGSTFAFDPSVRHRDTGGIFNLRLFEMSKPVIGAVNGAAVGFGASMLLPMDFRVIADTARIGFVFNSRGIVPDGASSWFLPRLVGPATALDWVMTGRLVGADEALSSGFAKSVHTQDELLPAAYEIAEQVIRGSAPVSAAIARRLLWHSMGDTSPMAAHRIESQAIAWSGSQEDAKEGVVAFQERRAPEWHLRVPRDLPEWFPWGEPEEF